MVRVNATECRFANRHSGRSVDEHMLQRLAVVLAVAASCQAFSPSIPAGGLRKSLPNVARHAGRPLTSRCVPTIVCRMGDPRVQPPREQTARPRNCEGFGGRASCHRGEECLVYFRREDLQQRAALLPPCMMRFSKVTAQCLSRVHMCLVS